jgi:hypothetical protein
MNRPRLGGPPLENGRHYEPPDAETRQHPLDYKVESGLAEIKRDTLRNRQMARQNGWTDADYAHWVETGVPP